MGRFRRNNSASLGKKVTTSEIREMDYLEPLPKTVHEPENCPINAIEPELYYRGLSPFTTEEELDRIFEIENNYFDWQ